MVFGITNMSTLSVTPRRRPEIFLTPNSSFMEASASPYYSAVVDIVRYHLPAAEFEWLVIRLS